MVFVLLVKRTRQVTTSLKLVQAQYLREMCFKVVLYTYIEVGSPSEPQPTTQHVASRSSSLGRDRPPSAVACTNLPGNASAKSPCAAAPEKYKTVAPHGGNYNNGTTRVHHASSSERQSRNRRDASMAVHASSPTATVFTNRGRIRRGETGGGEYGFIWLFLFYSSSKLTRLSPSSLSRARVRQKMIVTVAMSVRFMSHLLRVETSVPLLSKIDRTFSNSTAFPSSDISSHLDLSAFTNSARRSHFVALFSSCFARRLMLIVCVAFPSEI